MNITKFIRIKLEISVTVDEYEAVHVLEFVVVNFPMIIKFNPFRMFLTKN